MKDASKMDNKRWEMKNLLSNESQLVQYVENYKRIQRLEEFEEENPIHLRNAIV